MLHLWWRGRSLYLWSVRVGLRISFVETTDDLMKPRQEVSVEVGHFVLWGFMFSSVWAWWHLKAHVNIGIEASLFDAPDHGAFICVMKLVWPVFGDHMKVIVNFAPSWWGGRFVNVWNDSEIGAFIASLLILMEILGFVAWLELQRCWMEKNNPSLDQVSVCIYHQKSCLPIFPETLIV